MGGASSRVKNVNEQTYINQNEVDILNKNISNSIANTIINDAARCGSMTVNTQNIDFSGGHFGEDAHIDINQIQKNAISFQCQNFQESRNEVGNEMVQSMMNKLQQDNSTEIMAQLEAQAQAAYESGWFSMPGGGAKTNVENDIDFTIKNETYQELQNIIERSIENNFVSNNLAECTQNVFNDQGAYFRGTTFGNNAFVSINQELATNNFANCLQTQGVAQKITNSVMDAIGVESEITNTAETETEQTGTGTAEQINKGFFESLFGGLGDLFKPCGCSGNLCCLILCLAIILLLSGGATGYYQYNMGQKEKALLICCVVVLLLISSSVAGYYLT